jgi:hypothetical protein
VYDLINRYLAMWNETDGQLRRKLIDELWAQDAVYIDPLAEVQGRDAIDGLVAAVQAQFPGYTFTLLDSVDAHHGQARFTWSCAPASAPAGADPDVIGFDVAVTDSEGRLASVYGFIDKAPA